MSDYYVYLVSSLPSLSFGMKPPVTFGGFLRSCEGLIPEADLGVVRSMGASYANCSANGNATIKSWAAFETMLRNELVKIRAQRKKADPSKYLRADGCPDSSYTAHIAINAFRKTSPLESERALDLDRWKRLDELSAGHYFDLDTIVIYAVKLMILEKWHRITSADGREVLEGALA